MSSTRAHRQAPYRTRRGRSASSQNDSVIFQPASPPVPVPEIRTRQVLRRVPPPVRRVGRGRRVQPPDQSESSRDETSSSTESEGLQGSRDNRSEDGDGESTPELEPHRRTNRTGNQVVDLTCDQDDEVFIIDERRHDNPVIVGRTYTNRDINAIHQRRHMPPMLDIHLDVDLPHNQNQSTVNVTIDLDRSDFYMTPDTPPRPSAAQTQVADQPMASENTVECGICFDSLGQMKAANKKIMSTFCGHLFCDQCLREAMKTAMLCPQCRKRVSTSKVHQIFI